MNEAILIGNLTKDPELTETPTGVSVCRLSIAVGRPYKGQDGTQETDFFNVVVWRTQAEHCATYLRKGRKVAVIGSIQNRSYDDKDGNKRWVTEIIANRIEFLSQKPQEPQSGENPAPAERKAASGTYATQTAMRGVAPRPKLEPIPDDDLPF